MLSEAMKLAATAVRSAAPVNPQISQADAPVARPDRANSPHSFSSPEVVFNLGQLQTGASGENTVI